MSFYIDNAEIDLPCSIERSAELTASEVSGILLDKNYFNDLLGTYMKYTVAIAVPVGKEGLYASLYEVLSDPVDGHTFIFPYNQETIEVTGRIDVITDKYYGKENGVNLWRGIKFTVTSNHPSKTYTLGEAVNRGLTPLPDVAFPSIGDIYEYLSSGWVKLDVTGDDDTEY